MRPFLLLVTLFNFLIPAAFAAGSLFEQLSIIDQIYWKKLLHTGNNGISRADGELFFLSSIGKQDSAAELQATLDAFKNESGSSGWFHYHPQCVFRERFRFLKKLGLLSGVIEKTCPEFTAWREGLNADSITLIFSSSYPNNPSSLFGHTLIRLNQKNKSNDLLDYSVAYSAIPNKDDIGIVYAYKGLMGGYQGLLDVSKYYIKVNDYNNSESRDLIEYQLKMSPEQLDRLINHLWEIYQTTYFNYYFFNQNCSSILVDILAIPYDELTINKHARWYYLPGEMVKTFWKEGLVESVHLRPSLKKQLEKEFSNLDKQELAAVEKLQFEKSLKIHDGVITYLDFLRYQTKNQLSPDQKAILRTALIKRSTLPKKEMKVEKYDDGNRPESGHDPKKISFFVRHENSDAELGVELKQGHHDLMSNDVGYDPFSQFDFLTATFFYNKTKEKFYYDQFTIVDLVSLHPYRFYDPQFSWQAYAGGDKINSLYGKALGGYTFAPSTQSVIAFMAGAGLFWDGQYQHNFRLSPSFKVSFLTTLNTHFKLGLFNELSTYENIPSLQFSYFSSQNSEYRFIAKKKVLQLNYGYYF